MARRKVNVKNKKKKKKMNLKPRVMYGRESALWDKSLELGTEGLIATIDDPKKLLIAMKANVRRQKQRARSAV